VLHAHESPYSSFNHSVTPLVSALQNTTFHFPVTSSLWLLITKLPLKILPYQILIS